MVGRLGFGASEARRHYLSMRAGTLDDPELGKPQMAIWTSSAPSWAAFEPDIPHEPKQPTPLVKSGPFALARAPQPP